MMPYQNQNPNYYAQYLPNQQPYVNPYLQRMENLQQFQQALNPAPVQNQFPALGKIVESMDIVRVTDIPMDGNMYYFPKADGTEVYGKQFGTDGKTRILTFKPVLDSEPNNVSSDTEKFDFDGMNERINNVLECIRSLNEKLDKISKPDKVKKGGAENE